MEAPEFTYKGDFQKAIDTRKLVYESFTAPPFHGSGIRREDGIPTIIVHAEQASDSTIPENFTLSIDDVPVKFIRDVVIHKTT